MPQTIEELDNDITVWQITDDADLVSNIYCERPYVSPDCRRFLYARKSGELWDFLLCEFGSWKTEPVGRGILSSTVSYQGDYYYARKAGNNTTEFVRIDLNTGKSEVRFNITDSNRVAGHPTVSPDGRYMAFHSVISYSPQNFGIFLIDSETGSCDIICEDPFLCNAHSQFDDNTGRTLLIQHNRGCEYLSDGTRVKLVGEKDGCTLFLLEAMSGKITRLPVGIPYTNALTGHEAWIGKSYEIIFTVRPNGEFDERKGNILLVRTGENYRQIIPGVCMNHIGTTPCGRYFHGDGGHLGQIIVGSPRTGRFTNICLSHTTHNPAFGQQAHPHAYLSPDYRWMVFNSDRTGTPQTYAASVPPELLKDLDPD